MKKIGFKTLNLVLFGGIGFTALPASFAEDIGNIKIKAPTIKETQAAKSGQLLVIVFKDGLPAAGVEVQAGSLKAPTNSAGVSSFELPVHKNLPLKIKGVSETLKVNIEAGQESQVTVNLLSDQNSEVAVEAPSSLESPESQQGPRRSVQFRVLAPGGKPLKETTVLFSGLNEVFKTDHQGQIQAQIPEGVYAASFFHPEHQTYTLKDLNVATDGVNQAVTLRPASNELEEVLVLAPKIKGSLSSLVEIRKQSSAVTDVLGAEQMARAGDSDAASSLRRVTGLTLVGGKYVYVRGLGERYSGVQMNQFQLPSPEPSRRVVPLDLFPTSVMESIIVQKSYSPDLPGEFGGGVIQLKTRSLPESFFFRGNITNNFENSNNRLTHQGGSKDWLGMDDGSRALPSGIRDVLSKGLKLEKNQEVTNTGISEAELVGLSRSLPNNYGIDNTSQPSMPGMSLSMGNGWSFSNFKVGTSGSALYGQNTNQINRVDQNFNVASGSSLARESVRNTLNAEVETRLAGSFDLGVEAFKNHKLIASTFLLRNTSQLTQLSNTRDDNTGDSVETTTLAFTERQLWTQHLKGEHQFEKVPFKLDWRMGWSNAQRDSPDRREYSYDILQGSKSLKSGTSGNMRSYSELEDNSTERALDLTLPLTYKDREVLKFKVGVNEVDKSRRSDINRFTFTPDFQNSAVPFDLSQNPQELFQADNLRPGGFLLLNITNAADSYSGEQTIRAQYAMMEVNPHPHWAFLAGVRQERSVQEVNTFKYFDPGNPFSSSSLQMRDRLPAYSLTWKPNDKWRGRLAYSETLARPDFRELSTVGFIDDETGYEVMGNANLKGTVIRNLDHRWEYYFTADEYVSVGAFYKNFINPIEVTFLPGVNLIQSFDNAPEANNLGFEIEGRLGLRNVSRVLRRWTVLANATWIQSEIVLDERTAGVQTSSSRPLQGQSPYIYNVQLQYDRPVWGFSSALMYNFIGSRITEVGTNGRPDTYEQSFGQVDFIASLAMKKNWTLGFRARNIFDPEIEATQGDEMVRSFRRARVFSVVLGAVF